MTATVILLSAALLTTACLAVLVLLRPTTPTATADEVRDLRREALRAGLAIGLAGFSIAAVIGHYL